MKKADKNTKMPKSSSFHDVIVVATLHELLTVLGQPTCTADIIGNDYQFWWDMEASTGSYFTVYDWNELRRLKPENRVRWHIGGFSEMECEEGRYELMKALEAMRS